MTQLAATNLIMITLSLVVVGLGIFAGFQVWAAAFPPDHTTEELAARIDLYTCGYAHTLGNLGQGEGECRSEVSSAGIIPVVLGRNGAIAFFESGDDTLQFEYNRIDSDCEGGSCVLDEQTSTRELSNPLDVAAVCEMNANTFEIRADNCVPLTTEGLTITTSEGYVDSLSVSGTSAIESYEPARKTVNYPSRFPETNYSEPYLPRGLLPPNDDPDDDNDANAYPLYVEYLAPDKLFVAYMSNNRAYRNYIEQRVNETFATN